MIGLIWNAFTCNVRIKCVGEVFKYAFKKRMITENSMAYVSRITENKVVVKDGVSKDTLFI